MGKVKLAGISSGQQNPAVPSGTAVSSPLHPHEEQWAVSLDTCPRYRSPTPAAILVLKHQERDKFFLLLSSNLTQGHRKKN